MTIKDTPWYLRTYRWGQTNITERDPERYDVDWWRRYWRRTKTQGVIINAGGIVYYYPSRYPEVHHALYLKGRDLYGELVRIAREEGLSVLARMDSNRVHEQFYLQHPDWCAVDKDGIPYRAGELYLTCVSSPYYSSFIPNVLEEIIQRTHPDGITDNSWSGLDRERICHCSYCRDSFKHATGLDLPKDVDWEAEEYRRWIKWSYGQRLKIWDINNKATKKAGGDRCLWIGMNSGSIVAQSRSLRDYRSVCKNTEIIMLDSQTRSIEGGFQANAESGKLIHGLLGWDKLIPESTAMYQAGHPTYRLASKSEPEVRLWAFEGFAGGIQPWWHHIGAYHEDRRQYDTAEKLFNWHFDNEELLINRKPVATVGIVYSQQNIDFYGKTDPEKRCMLPWRGMTTALIRAGIPYIPIHIDDIDRLESDISTLVLPDVGSISDKQSTMIHNFIKKGGSLVASGRSGLYDEWGDRRDDFVLSDILGVHKVKGHFGTEDHGSGWNTPDQHSYLRLIPELRRDNDGPHIEGEPDIIGSRHQVLSGFERTDIIPFGGRLEAIKPAKGTEMVMTLIPPFPIYPPETSWMRTESTPHPGLVLGETSYGGRTVYLAADIDRCYGRDNLPDHGTLLSNIVKWASNGQIPITVDCPAFLDCHIYRQPDRLILHVVNLTNDATWRPPIHESTAVGPVRISLKEQPDLSLTKVELKVAKKEFKPDREGEYITFSIDSVVEHELAVLS